MVDMITDASRWHLSLNGGAAGFGNFLLQQTPLGAVAIRGSRGFAFGGGGGFDYDENNQFRLNYTYTGTDLRYRDWRGVGSNLLNVSNIGKVNTNVVTLEAAHYFVGSRSLVSPYAGFGFSGSWNHLSPDVVATSVFFPNTPTQFLTTPGGAQKFGIGATANLGAQVRLTNEFFTRLEWNTMNMPNPFNGNRSYQSPGGITYDQPSRVQKTEWRLAGVYYLGKQAPAAQKPTVATSP